MRVKENISPSKQLYLTVWRWHFFAAWFVIPFALLLSVTGTIYLLKPYVEPWLYRDLIVVDRTGDSSAEPVSLSDQQRIAESFVAKGKANSVRVGQGNRSSEFIVSTPGRTKYMVYVDPYDGTLIGGMQRDKTLMRRVRKLHGELMMGWLGSALVELTACWLIVMLLSGIYLGWPRGRFRFAGFFYPRLTAVSDSGRRLFWRDIHVVVAVYSSLGIMLLLVTGLPWTNVWGGAFKRVQAVSGQARPVAGGRFVRLKSPPPIKSSEHPRMTLDDAANLAKQMEFPVTSADFTITLPSGKDGVYGFQLQPNQPSGFRAAYVNQYDSHVVAAASWNDFPLSSKAVTTGIRLHQGELFGIANVVFMMFAALSLIPISISGLIMWYKRRPSGGLGIPPAPTTLSGQRLVAVIIVSLAILLPLFGASLIVLGVGSYVIRR